MNYTPGMLDRLCMSADTALRTVFAKPIAHTFPSALPNNAEPLSETQQRHAAGLMRVNHVGEVCAQALYSAQSLMTRDPQKQELLEAAAKEEEAHLAWTHERLEELNARPSLLNPMWYAGAFGLGLVAGRLGDAVSLGFVVETEAQVQAHLASHLTNDAIGLPAEDVRSRAIVAQMQADEAAHGERAKTHGGQELPALVQTLMRSAAKVMTTTAYRI